MSGEAEYDPYESDSNRPDPKRLRIWTAKELADCDLTPPGWVVEQVMIQHSYGPVAGEKKTLKTYLMGLLNVAIAKGGKFLGAFPVPQAGPVLSFVGEGGRIPHVRRLKRICAAMNVRLEDLPLFHVYDLAALNSETFHGTLVEGLEEHEPVHTSIDPLYVYHPTNVDTKNLYQRGPMLTQLSAACLDAGSTLLAADHFNKSGSGNGLERISMSGVAEWADTWMIATHRKAPDVEAGDFYLTIDIGSRQWGGRKFDVDLSVGRFDPTYMSHDGPVRFTVREHVGDDRVAYGKAERLIEEILLDHPYEFTKTQLRDKVGGNRSLFDEAWNALAADNIIRSERVKKQRDDGQMKTFDCWGIR